jgi:hypothetical protein
MTKLAQFSLGTGDRFARQAAAQLSAVSAAAETGNCPGYRLEQVVSGAQDHRFPAGQHPGSR